MEHRRACRLHMAQHVTMIKHCAGQPVVIEMYGCGDVKHVRRVNPRRLSVG
jgi:hypothetical protein